MDLERLKEFVTLAECESLNEAAKKLHLSPGTLSARLHTFEESLDVRLTQVEGKQLRLSLEGFNLLPHARGILNQLRRTEETLAAAASHNYRRIKIALSETSLPLFLGPFLDQINQTWPGIRIDLVDGSRYSMQESLMNGDVDVYYSLLMDQAVPDGLERYDIALPFHHVLIPRHHPLAQRTSIHIQDLDGECFILSPNGAEPVVRNFQLTNLSSSGILYKTYDSETDAAYTKLLVPIGKGVLLTPTPVPDLPPNTVSISVKGLPYPATPCVLVNKLSTNPDVRAFMQDYIAFCKDALLKDPAHQGKSS